MLSLVAADLQGLGVGAVIVAMALVVRFVFLPNARFFVQKGKTVADTEAAFRIVALGMLGIAVAIIVLSIFR